MTKKQYMICRLAIIVLLSFLISLSISLNNYYLPLVFTATAVAGLHYCRKQLKTGEVIADERDYQVAGKAARYAISIYSLLGVIGVFVLMAISHKNEMLYILSQYLAFSICFLMLLNAFLFKYLNKKGK